MGSSALGGLDGFDSRSLHWSIHQRLEITVSLIESLIRERAGLVARGLKDRVKQVDEQLRLLGAKGAAPVKRAEKRRK